MEQTRIDALIEFLYGSYSPIAWACERLGFKENDLTDEEMDTLYEHIFQCEECGCWCDAAEEEIDWEQGSVCGSCSQYADDEEEDE